MARKNLFERIFDFGRNLFSAKSSSRQARKKSEPISTPKPVSEIEPLHITEPVNAPEPDSVYESIQTPVSDTSSSRLSEPVIEKDYRLDEIEDREFERKKRNLEPIINEANRRIGNLMNLGLASSALERVEQETGRQFLTLDYAESIPELITEATRARVFLNDKTSTIEGAKVYTAQLNAAMYKGKFGNQYHNWEHRYKNFDTRIIDEEIAKQVFKNYRKLEELRAADIIGEGAYGSENLIIAMYDAQIRGQDSFEVGLEQLDAFYTQKSAEWQERFERSNNVSAILGFYLNEDEEGWYF